MGVDGRNGGEGQDDVTENGDCNTDADCLISAPVLIGEICSKKRHAVDPERVEGVDAVGSLGTLAQSSRDTLSTTAPSSCVMDRAWRTLWLG